MKRKRKILVKLTNKFKRELNREMKKREVKTDRSQMYRVYGVQKQPPTGILVPSILESKRATPVDLVFRPNGK